MKSILNIFQLHYQALNQAQDVSVANYRIQQSISLEQAAYITDIAHCKDYSSVCPRIGITVANTYRVCDDIYSQDLCYVSKKVFLEYSPYYGFFLVGDGNNIICDMDRYHEGNVLWSHTQQGSSLHPGFSQQGMAVCKSGEILISLWNNEIGKRSIGKVISLTRNFIMVEDFEIFMDKNRPLLTCPTCLKENGNGDICVSDVGSVVVTDAAAMLRFRYQGVSGNSNFEPYGLCCDSLCNIIIADMKNDKIHVIDKDGSFLHYVRYEGIKMPRALCIDENDNVYVGEWNTTSIKVISR